MIICQIAKDKEKIKSLEISGHADYAKYNQDIVCAGVSALSFTIANKIKLIEPTADITINENKMIFNNKQQINILIETLELGIVMLKEQYPKNIKIQEVKDV